MELKFYYSEPLTTGQRIMRKADGDSELKERILQREMKENKEKAKQLPQQHGTESARWRQKQKKVAAGIKEANRELTKSLDTRSIKLVYHNYTKNV